MSAHTSHHRIVMEADTLRCLEQEVREFEYAWGVAYVRRDMTALEQILADEYTFTDPLGEVSDKRKNIAHIRSGACVIEDTNSADIRVRVYGLTAVVTARSTFKARYKGFGFRGECQYTNILVKRDGRWHAVASQATLARRTALVPAPFPRRPSRQPTALQQNRPCADTSSRPQPPDTWTSA
ncbi:MAG: nuclear transport factor 2 family protein, partial [Acidobacteria bacterium]|nr:nuclear transport factor 2 family protein [Acidobacteriota bacterium]